VICFVTQFDQMATVRAGFCVVMIVTMIMAVLLLMCSIMRIG